MHPRHEGHDATGLGELSEVGQQQGGDALALPGVRDREGELGAIARLGDEARVRDDRLLRAGDRHQAGAALDEHPRRALHVRTRPEEAEPARLRRQAAKEGGDALHVSGAGRAQVDGGAVTQDDVAAADGRGMAWVRAYVGIGRRRIREEPHPIATGRHAYVTRRFSARHARERADERSAAKRERGQA